MSLRTAALAATLAFPALALGACGNGDEPPDTTTTAPATTTQARPAKPTAMRRELERQLRAALRAQGETRSLEVECVVRELRRTLSNRAVAAAARAIEADEEIPEAVTDAAYDAGSACRKP